VPRMRPQAAPHPGHQGRRSRTPGSLSGEQLQKGAVAAETGITTRTVAQVGPHRFRLFRGKLLIQIFPEAFEDLYTFHSFYLVGCAHPKRALPAEQPDVTVGSFSRQPAGSPLG
jgi:hypothetical protein